MTTLKLRMATLLAALSVFSAGCGAAIDPTSLSMGSSLVSSNTLANTLLMSPAQVTVAVGNQVTFTASGGTGGPYTYALAGGSGSISSATGIYTAAGNSGDTAMIQALDGVGDAGYAMVLVTSPLLAIQPGSTKMYTNATLTFSASGGVPPYTFGIISGAGSMSGATFTAPSTTGTAIVGVMDSQGAMAASTLTIQNNPIYVIPPNYMIVPFQHLNY